MQEFRVGEATYRFQNSLREGVVLSRPNRFVMIVRAGGRTIRCHCPTTGRLGDVEPSGIRCLYSASSRPSRKTSFTVEAISIDDQLKKSWIGINQTAANRYVEFFIRNGQLSKMATGEVKREVKLGRSRIDFLVGNTFVEVKTPLIVLPLSVAAKRAKRSRFNSFDRLIRHMGELSKSLSSGRRAVMAMCYLYDAKPFRPPALDRTNSRILTAARLAQQSGVETWQVNLRVDRKGVTLIRFFKNKLF
jgi:sugar fermentation stimulation protein A